MTISQAYLERLARTPITELEDEGPKPRRGADIFEGTPPYPASWPEFVGQQLAKARLQAAVKGAKRRGVRLGHVLLASGTAGIGKSSLARLIAGEMGVGFMELSGPVSVDDAREALRNMEDGDVLFWDELHQAVTGGKSKVEWLLHLLQDGRLLTAAGPEKMPDVTVVAATTDAGKLPTTILGRFPIKPVLAAYGTDDALEIMRGLAARMGFGTRENPLRDGDLAALCRASMHQPREMKSLLETYRDTAEATDTGTYDLDLTLEWSGSPTTG